MQRHLPPDIAVDEGRALDRGPAGDRQRADAGQRAAVIGVGHAEQPRRHRPDRPPVRRPAEQGLGRDPRLIQPVERQIDAPALRILADVAGDVGQLHRQAQIGGAGEAATAGAAHDHRHHHAHRAGHARRIVEHVVEGAVFAPVLVPFEPLDHRRRDRLGQAVARRHRGEGAVAGQRQGRAVVDGVEPVAQLRDARPAEARLVHQIVRRAAEGVERAGGDAHVLRQQPRGGVEGLGAGEDGLVAEPSILGRERADTRAIGHGDVSLADGARGAPGVILS